ncbi:carboxylesterase family protein [Talaromyces proteolyticus]|uniref:Carboxylic ester hydrolase n=1 Tax=Talaromyces proteolyticus TaxID=1131652 RepID=A0AAD4KXM8_9EURO|nr:carboxylesterase family protein [Talaromyces proteolyticus]KAH8703436.1 carboxylesterase family protein [Talaromyces proteolyticus]
MSPSCQYELTEIIPTTNGPIRGFVSDGMRQFLGIPYASPPTGELRWRPPVAPIAWEEPLESVSFGNVCAQHTPSFPGFGHTSYTEDCLYLNVFTPAHSRREPEGSKKLPVMAFIHGGGFSSGASNDYNPIRLVNDGNVVFVSLNYRVNIFGFFSHPAINAEDHPSGNYGILDQQFALTWIQRNIEVFGGDATNVTIFGESAGGASVMAHMVSPGSIGLFHKVIIQSGGSPPTMPFPTIESLEKQGIGLASAAGCKEQIPRQLRLIATKDIMAADALPDDTFGLGKFPFGLMEDGEVVPKSLREKFSTGQFSRVPMIIGVNRDEFSWFQAMIELRSGKVVSADFYPQILTDTIDLLNTLHLNGVIVPSDAISQVLELYPAGSHPSASRALAAAIGDAGLISTAGRRTTRVMAQHVTEVYAYEFDVPDSPSPWPEVSFPYGSAHTIELQYLFPLFRGGSGKAQPLTDSQQQLARQMVHYWTTFAHRGTPNFVDDSAKRVSPSHWLAYKAKDDNIMLLCTPTPHMTNEWGVRHNSDFWDSFY